MTILNVTRITVFWQTITEMLGAGIATGSVYDGMVSSRQEMFDQTGSRCSWHAMWHRPGPLLTSLSQFSGISCKTKTLSPFSSFSPNTRPRIKD